MQFIQVMQPPASIYAVHQVKDGWEIICPSDDPYRPAYGRVDVIRRYGWREAGRDRDGNVPLSWLPKSTSAVSLDHVARCRSIRR
jgi:hypothetical protein